MNQPSSCPTSDCVGESAPDSRNPSPPNGSKGMSCSMTDRDQAKRLRDVLVTANSLSGFSGITVATIANIEDGRTNNPPPSRDISKPSSATSTRFRRGIVCYRTGWISRWEPGSTAPGPSAACLIRNSRRGFHGDTRNKVLKGLRTGAPPTTGVALRSLKAEGRRGEDAAGVELCRRLVDGIDVSTNEPYGPWASFSLGCFPRRNPLGQQPSLSAATYS